MKEKTKKDVVEETIVEETAPSIEVIEETPVEEKPAKETKKKDKKKGKKKAEKKVSLPKRIKVTMSLANARHSYIPGISYEVGRDVSEDTARAWLGCGVAIEDKSSEGPEETK